MKTKICKTCLKDQLTENYYVHSKMKDGRLNICKDCVKTRVKNHRKLNDKVREYDRWRYQNQSHRKEKQKLYNQKYIKTHPEKYKARIKVNNAIRDKKLKKLPCVICGDKNVHAHHKNYNKPLDVIWLCPLHHSRSHHE